MSLYLEEPQVGKDLTVEMNGKDENVRLMTIQCLINYSIIKVFIVKMFLLLRCS